MSATDRNDRCAKPPAGAGEHDSFSILDQCFKDIRGQFKALQEQCEDLRMQRDQYREEISKQLNELAMIRSAVSSLQSLHDDTRAARDRLKEENLRLVVELSKFNPLTLAPTLARHSHVRDHDSNTKGHNLSLERNVDEIHHECHDIDGDIVMANSSNTGAVGGRTRSVSSTPLRTPSDHVRSESSQGPYRGGNSGPGRDHDRQKRSSGQAPGLPYNSAIPLPPTRFQNGWSTALPSQMAPSLAVVKPNASQEHAIPSSSPPSPAPLPPPRHHPRLIALSPAPLARPPVQEDMNCVIDLTSTSTSSEESAGSLISPRTAAPSTPLSPPVVSVAPQIDLYVDPQEVLPLYKKEGPDWYAILNPEPSGPQPPDNQITRSLDVQLVHSLAHPSVVSCVRFSFDDKYLATGCNGEVRLYEVVSGRKICVLEHTPCTKTPNSNSENYIRGLCFSPDSNYLATGGEDASVRLWDIHAPNVLATFQGHQQPVYGLDYSRDGRIIVSGSGDKTVRVWETRDITGSSCQVFRPPEGNNVDFGVTSVCLSPDSRLVAASFFDNVVRIWDVQTGELVKILEGHTDAVYSVAFTPSGNGVVSGSLDTTLTHWDIVGLTGKPDRYADDDCDDGKEGIRDARRFTGHKDYVLSIAVSPDGKFVASGSKDRSVQLWDANTAIPQFMLLGHKNSVISVAINGAGDLLATGAGDWITRIWRFEAI